jgi:hypothetical protein
MFYESRNHIQTLGVRSKLHTDDPQFSSDLTVIWRFLLGARELTRVRIFRRRVKRVLIVMSDANVQPVFGRTIRRPGFVHPSHTLHIIFTQLILSI